MRVFVDASCPRLLVTRLREIGLEVEYAVDLEAGILDEVWAKRATALGQIIVSQDYDFGELARAGATPLGVVQIAPMRGPLADRVDRVVDAIATDLEALKGVLTTIDAKRVRRRALAG